jgi:hypothetical protein
MQVEVRIALDADVFDEFCKGCRIVYTNEGGPAGYLAGLAPS